MKVSAAVSFCVLFLLGPQVLHAQDLPAPGSREISFWVSSGRGTTGSTANSGVFSLGFRYGWVLTAPHGPGPLRGSFEYAADVSPLYFVAQRKDSIGANINPVILKWDFNSRGRIAPYVEISGGSLYTKHKVPFGTSNVNFSPGAAVGMQYLGRKWNPVFALRYVHISNAGLSDPNPGINTVQFLIGLNHFRRH